MVSVVDIVVVAVVGCWDIVWLLTGLVLKNGLAITVYDSLESYSGDVGIGLWVEGWYHGILGRGLRCGMGWVLGAF